MKSEMTKLSLLPLFLSTLLNLGRKVSVILLPFYWFPLQLYCWNHGEKTSERLPRCRVVTLSLPTFLSLPLTFLFSLSFFQLHHLLLAILSFYVPSFRQQISNGRERRGRRSIILPSLGSLSLSRHFGTETLSHSCLARHHLSPTFFFPQTVLSFTNILVDSPLLPNSDTTPMALFLALYVFFLSMYSLPLSVL